MADMSVGSNLAATAATTIIKKEEVKPAGTEVQQESTSSSVAQSTSTPDDTKLAFNAKPVTDAQTAEAQARITMDALKDPTPAKDIATPAPVSSQSSETSSASAGIPNPPVDAPPAPQSAAAVLPPPSSDTSPVTPTTPTTPATPTPAADGTTPSSPTTPTTPATPATPTPAADGTTSTSPTTPTTLATPATPTPAADGTTSTSPTTPTTLATPATPTPAADGTTSTSPTTPTTPATPATPTPAADGTTPTTPTTPVTPTPPKTTPDGTPIVDPTNIPNFFEQVNLTDRTIGTKENPVYAVLDARINNFNYYEPKPGASLVIPPDDPVDNLDKTKGLNDKKVDKSPPKNSVGLRTDPPMDNGQPDTLAVRSGTYTVVKPTTTADGRLQIKVAPGVELDPSIVTNSSSSSSDGTATTYIAPPKGTLLQFKTDPKAGYGDFTRIIDTENIQTQKFDTFTDTKIYYQNPNIPNGILMGSHTESTVPTPPPTTFPPEPPSLFPPYDSTKPLSETNHPDNYYPDGNGGFKIIMP